MKISLFSPFFFLGFPLLTGPLKEVGKIKKNVFVRDGKVLVSKIKARESIKEDILRAVNLIGGLEKIIRKGDNVLLKPNFNTADPPPASSDPELVKTVIELLYSAGAGKVILGESSMYSLSTEKVFKDAGVWEMAKNSGAEIVPFEKWVEVKTKAKDLRKVALAKEVLEAEKIVYLACLKTHSLASFTLSLKLAMGMIRPEDRLAMHFWKLEEKIADLNTLVSPDLIILDGRKAFITGGPAQGTTVEPNLILASADRIALDLEAIKVIKSFPGNNLKKNPWEYPQIKRAVELNLGVKNGEDYEVVSDFS